MLELYKNYNGIEVGLDECARGVMFGRLYASNRSYYAKRKSYKIICLKI